MIVEITQYMRPDGRQVQYELEIGDECKQKYDEIVACGCRLTGEQMMNGQVSQTIEADDFDFDIKITKGPDLDENKKALEEMIMRFDTIKFKKMLSHYS